MKRLFIDCGMGAAGDMLGAALLELTPDPEAVLTELNALGIPGVTFERVRTEKCGIRGTRLLVRINGDEEDCGHARPPADAERGLRDVEQLLPQSGIPDTLV